MVDRIIRVRPRIKRKIKKLKVVSGISELVKANDFKQISANFIEAINTRGFNERGERVILSRWYLELLSAISDFRIAETYTAGVAQLGKTLGHTNLLLFVVEELGLNALWAYDLQASLNIQVPSNFRPVAGKWLAAVGKSSSDGAKNNTIYQIGSATIQFTYVSTSAVKSKHSERAAAGGVAVGVSRDLVFKEERSQYPYGADAPLNRRMDAGRIPTKPIRELGTCGNGFGIEASIKMADHHFYPHFECYTCGSIFPLHPKGCLLKEFKSTRLGVETLTYLSESGRPVSWFYKDFNDPVNTAYFGCPGCSAEIEEDSRKNAWYQCLSTGIKLADYLFNLPDGIPSKRLKIGISISPLLKIVPTNLAAEIIAEGLTSQNPLDWQQQMLGVESDSIANSISLDLLKAAIASPIPERMPNFTLGGLDCGRGGHWLTKVAYYLPDNFQKLPLVGAIESTIRHIKFASIVDKNGLLNMLSDVDYGIVDNEPDRDWSTNFCRNSQFEMADQISGFKHAVTRSTVQDGGIASPCWNIRNEKFMRFVLNGFLLSAADGYPLYRFGSEFERYLGTMASDRNPLRHIMAVKLDPMSQKWIRPSDNVDDIYFSLMFNEVAFYLYLMKMKTQLGIGLWKF